MEKNSPNRISTEDQITSVLDKMAEIAHKASTNDYIFRGESKWNSYVSSTLYRKYSHIEETGFDISVVQKEKLQAAKAFVGKIDDVDDLLAQLQHYGSPTNLIDFTTDYLIALFFACDGDAQEDGRVILLERSAYPLLQPRHPTNRVIAQKSTFVQPQRGFVEPSDIVVVPAALKTAILDHLRTSHGVRVSTIYNDLHGFIRYESAHESAYAEFYAGVTHHRKKHLQTALDHYDKSIQLNPQIEVSYQNRGAIYLEKGEYQLAIQNIDKAIELNPKSARSLERRGRIFRMMGNFSKAIVDLDKSIQLDPTYSVAYLSRGNVHGDMGKGELAIRDYGRALELDPNFAEAYCNRGAVYADRGEYDLAFRDFDRSIELDATDATTYSNRGATYWHKGELKRAIEDYDKAIELDPRFGVAYYNRGECWLSVEDWDRARADFMRAWDLNYDVASVFSQNFGSVFDFEHKLGVKLPTSVSKLLTCRP